MRNFKPVHSEASERPCLAYVCHHNRHIYIDVFLDLFYTYKKILEIFFSLHRYNFRFFTINGTRVKIELMSSHFSVAPLPFVKSWKRDILVLLFIYYVQYFFIEV